MQGDRRRKKRSKRQRRPSRPGLDDKLVFLLREVERKQRSSTSDVCKPGRLWVRGEGAMQISSKTPCSFCSIGFLGWFCVQEERVCVCVYAIFLFNFQASVAWMHYAVVVFFLLVFLALKMYTRALSPLLM